jgi:hypothetical protein
MCEHVFICHINKVALGTEMKLCIRVYCKGDLKHLHFISIGDLGLHALNKFQNLIYQLISKFHIVARKTVTA